MKASTRRSLRAWVILRQITRGILTLLRLRGRRKDMSGFNSCKTHVVVVPKTLLYGTQLSKDEFERTKIEVEIQGDSTPTILSLQCM
jgi:hypothetical protein